MSSTNTGPYRLAIIHQPLISPQLAHVTSISLFVDPEPIITRLPPPTSYGSIYKALLTPARITGTYEILSIVLPYWTPLTNARDLLLKLQRGTCLPEDFIITDESISGLPDQPDQAISRFVFVYSAPQLDTSLSILSKWAYLGYSAPHPRDSIIHLGSIWRDLIRSKCILLTAGQISNLDADFLGEGEWKPIEACIDWAAFCQD